MAKTLSSVSNVSSSSSTRNHHSLHRRLVHRFTLTIRFPDEDNVHDSPSPTPSSTGEQKASLHLETHHIVLIAVAGVLFILAILAFWMWRRRGRKALTTRNRLFTIDGSVTESPRRSMESVQMFTPDSYSAPLISPSLHPMDVYSPPLPRRLECEFLSASISADILVYEHLTENEVHQARQSQIIRSTTGQSSVSVTPRDSPYLLPQSFITTIPPTYLPSPSLSLNPPQNTTISPLSPDRTQLSSSQRDLTEEGRTPSSMSLFNQTVLVRLPDRRPNSIHGRSLPKIPTRESSSRSLPAQ